MRLFISIPLSKKSANSVEKMMKKIRPKFLSHDKVDFVPKSKWHITITFLGKQSKEDIEDIQEAIEKSIVGFKSPDIQFDKIKYAPSKAKKTGMLWLVPSKATSQYLESIKNHIEANLKERGVKWKKDHKKYRSHVILAKFKPAERKKLPKVEKGTEITFRAQSVDLVHSIPQKSGRKHEILFSMKYK